MNFPANVEKWRAYVQRAIGELLTNFPKKKNAYDAIKHANANLSDIILAIIQTESAGNELATGDKGNSVGLMQLNWGAGTPQGEGYTGTKEGLYDAATNIYYGTSYFLTQLVRYKTIPEAILAYNAGSVRLNSAGLPINEEYLRKVLSFLEKKNQVFSDCLRSELYSLLSSGFSNATRARKRRV